MRRIGLVAMCALALSCAGRVSEEVAMGGGETEPAFAVHAARLDAAIIELSQLAVAQAMDGNVRVFAAAELREHRKHAAQLREIANARGWDLGEGADVEHRIFADELVRASAKEFDAAYMQLMIRDHVEAVSAYRRYVRSAAPDPELVAFARSSLSALEGHETSAEMTSRWVQPTSW